MPLKDKQALNTYMKEYYAKNKTHMSSRVRERTKRYNKNKLAKLVELRSTTPCTDCGCCFPYYIMEFDHVPERGEKKYSVYTAYTTSKRAFEEELAKCDIVCSNCHSERTHKRKCTDTTCSCAAIGGRDSLKNC